MQAIASAYSCNAKRIIVDSSYGAEALRSMTNHIIRELQKGCESIVCICGLDIVKGALNSVSWSHTSTEIWMTIIEAPIDDPNPDGGIALG
jgi:hypothetical protein